MMPDEKINAGPGEGESTAAALPGKPLRSVGGLDSFAVPAGSGASPSAGGKGKGGKPAKKKTGRPTKNLAGFSEAALDEISDDPEVEAARLEFEEVLVELLVATTDNFADTRFVLLAKKFPEAEARGLSDKFRLTEKERKYFGGVAVRLWRKYLGDKYLFTDESIAGIYALKYFMRNFEGFNQARKIESELNAKSDDKQPGLQGATRPGTGSQPNGQEHANGATDRDSSRVPGISL
jgi:hypothetical protein